LKKRTGAMAFVLIQVDEFLQFEGWSITNEDGSEDIQFEGLNGFFSALRINNVELLQGSSFLFDPQLIFAASAGSTQFNDPGLFPNPEHFATILIDPSKNLTFTGSGMAPMVLVRDVYVLGHETPEAGVPVGPTVGAPTVWSYSSTTDTVIFESTGRVPVPVQEVTSTL
jgi:hypothetical protein